MNRHRLATAALLLALCGLAAFVYSPGLAGGFLFDDFVNLDALGRFGAVDTFPGFLRYITSGTADPIGRPLSLLTFLLDARSWPADPAPFLRTNIALHVLNGMLLFVLVRRLEGILQPEQRNNAHVALLGAGLWLLHPLFVSTTLYAVQREAMLPVTFSIAGLLLWIRGRQCVIAAPRGSLVLLLAGSVGCTLAAVLCKANGALLPLLIWVVDRIILSNRAHPLPSTGGVRLARLLTVIVPSVALLAYLLHFIPQAAEIIPDRGWSITQRLLTQPRAIVEYLGLLVVPRTLSPGLFNDAYAVSSSLVSPPSTLPSIAVVVVLLTVAVLVRHRQAALSCALLFFFCGHLLESTFVPLELFFEHRNYLPSILLFWPVSRWLLGGRFAAPLKYGAASLLMLVFAFLTWQRASLWGHQSEQALLWAATNPDSSRAQAIAAVAEIRRGHPDQAIRRLQPILDRKPHDLQIALNLANAYCAQAGLDDGMKKSVARAIANARHGDQLLFQWLNRSLDSAKAGKCRGLDEATVAMWLDAARQNRRFTSFAGRRQDILHLEGRLALERGDGSLAFEKFLAALGEDPRPDVAAAQTALLGSRGHLQEALGILDGYERARDLRQARGARGMRAIHGWLLERQGYWDAELARLRRVVLEEMASPGPTSGQSDANVP